MKSNIIVGTESVAESAWTPPLVFRSSGGAQSQRLRLLAASVRGLRSGSGPEIIRH